MPPVDTFGWGEGRYALNAAQTELTFVITAWDLSGPVTAAHFHNAPEGENGDIVFDLGGFLTEIHGEVNIAGTSQLDDWAIDNAAAELLAGNIYVNLHTEMHPDGEIRAQVIVAGESESDPPAAGWGCGL